MLIVKPDTAEYETKLTPLAHACMIAPTVKKISAPVSASLLPIMSAAIPAHSEDKRAPKYLVRHGGRVMG